jgi:hypothetical protein
MSSDIFLACLRGENTETFKRSLFEEIFGRQAINPRLPFTSVTYADGGAEVYGAEEDETNYVGFDHFGGDTFFAALHELALRTRSVIYWPANEGAWAAVAEVAVIALLPMSFEREGPQAVRVVRSGRELQDVYYGRQ